MPLQPFSYASTCCMEALVHACISSCRIMLSDTLCSLSLDSWSCPGAGSCGMYIWAVLHELQLPRKRTMCAEVLSVGQTALLALWRLVAEPSSPLSQPTGLLADAPG